MTDTSTGNERPAHKMCYPSLGEAQAIIPPSDKFRVFAVTDPAGRTMYTWASSVEGAVVNLARQDGFVARVAEPKSVVTKEKVALKLVEFTDEELAALGLTRKKAKK